jgi:excisionase family DNA binding protein
MRTHLEQEDIQALGDYLLEKIKPLISCNGNHQAEDIIFDVNGLAKYLNVSHKWIYERTQFKEMPYMKVKGLLRFRKKDIDKWLNSHNVPPVNSSERILRVIK